MKIYSWGAFEDCVIASIDDVVDMQIKLGKCEEKNGKLTEKGKYTNYINSLVKSVFLKEILKILKEDVFKFYEKMRKSEDFKPTADNFLKYTKNLSKKISENYTTILNNFRVQLEENYSDFEGKINNKSTLDEEEFIGLFESNMNKILKKIKSGKAESKDLSCFRFACDGRAKESKSLEGLGNLRTKLLWFSKIVHFTKHFFFRTPLESYNLT